MTLKGGHLERERVNHQSYQQHEQPVGTLPRGVNLGLPPVLVRALAQHLRPTRLTGAVTEISRGHPESVRGQGDYAEKAAFPRAFAATVARGINLDAAPRRCVPLRTQDTM